MLDAKILGIKNHVCKLLNNNEAKMVDIVICTWVNQTGNINKCAKSTFIVRLCWQNLVNTKIQNFPSRLLDPIGQILSKSLFLLSDCFLASLLSFPQDHSRCEWWCRRGGDSMMNFSEVAVSQKRGSIFEERGWLRKETTLPRAE